MVVAIGLTLAGCTTVAPIDYYWSGDEKDRRGDYAGAIVDYSEAIRLEPGVPTLYVFRARAYANAGDYDRAIEDYTRVIGMRAGAASVYAGRGSAYLQKQDYDQAITDFDQALKVNAGFAPAYLNRGIAYLRRDTDGAVEDAIADFRRVLKISQDPELRAEAEQRLQELGVTP